MRYKDLKNKRNKKDYFDYTIDYRYGINCNPILLNYGVT